jgi:DHA3 family tetracycline resistance protein-like MFS transporter
MTLLGVGRALPPRLLYIGTQSIDALLLSMAYTTYGLYAVQAATLGPLELVLVGTVMESSIFLAEIPTGMVADIYGRRLSVIVGLYIIGVGIALIGAVPTFWCIALGSVLLGIGGTFISGAHQAWLADEIGEVQAAPVYMRATQLSQIGSLVGIPLNVALASMQLQLPMLVGGAGFWGLASLLLLTMPEQGYRPTSYAQRNAWQGMRATLHAGLRTVRGHAALLSILVITIIYGMSSEALSRLAPLHVLNDTGLPSYFTAATWFGILHAGAFLGGAVVTWLVTQTIDLHNPRRIVQLLLVLTVVMLLATLSFALAGVFWFALIAVWMTRWMRIAMRPLVVAWVNRGLAPSARATVLSMLGQAEALGEVCGGPVLGLIGTLHTVRTALVCACGGAAPSAPAIRPSSASEHTACAQSINALVHWTPAPSPQCRHDLLSKAAHGRHNLVVCHIAKAHLTQQVLHAGLTQRGNLFGDVWRGTVYGTSVE